MLEKEPVYFADFRKFVESKFSEVKNQLDEVIENQDTHFEAIGELKVQVTGVEVILRKKADDSDVRDLEKRTNKLEKVVFA